jgi:hypothetical protein
MTKKQAQQWLLEAGFKSAYSGNDKTLYVKGITQAQLDYFGLACSFTIKAYKK